MKRRRLPLPGSGENGRGPRSGETSRKEGATGDRVVSSTLDDWFNIRSSFLFH